VTVGFAPAGAGNQAPTPLNTANSSKPARMQRCLRIRTNQDRHGMTAAVPQEEEEEEEEEARSTN
jgi:hypothetical protein